MDEIILLLKHSCGTVVEVIHWLEIEDSGLVAVPASNEILCPYCNGDYPPSSFDLHSEEVSYRVLH